MKHREALLEAGLVALLLSLLGGGVLALVGRALGQTTRARRHALPPPSAGSVAPDRHWNVSGPAAR